MINKYTDMEPIRNYGYKGKDYYLEIFYTEGQYIEVFASFQIDIDMETDDIVGIGEGFDHNKTRAIIKAIKHLNSQFC